MSKAIEGLKPDLVWKYFADICRIPRGSKNEAAIAQYVLNTASKLGLAASQDEWGNVVVRKVATPGREAVRSVALQGHLDMVCEKNASTVHDFSKDPIELVRRDNVLMANGTTLGADNGIAVATNLAIMESSGLEHGPLELLFTVDEETGLTGATNLKADFLKSRTLINLDSEEEGALYVGCSGGRNTTGTWKVELQTASAACVPVLVSVKGLKGGHSGLDIDKGRGNSIKILNRVLIVLSELGARLSTIRGGNKSNAIPREAEALVFVPKRRLGKARSVAESLSSILRAELASIEPDLAIDLVEQGASGTGDVFKKSLQRRLYQTISGLPHGVIKMSADISWLVETSTNVAVISTDSDRISLITSQRSSVASELDEVCQMVSSVLELGGASIERSEGYPGWKPDMNSPILKIARETYQMLFGKEPEVKAVHAGLECGIIGEKFPGMDMVSFGPTLEGVHSPDEKIYIDTVEKFWTFLSGILKNVR